MPNFFQNYTQTNLHQAGKQCAPEKDSQAIGFGKRYGNGQEAETRPLDNGQARPHRTHADGLD